jgi:hypothetical protein
MEKMDREYNKRSIKGFYRMRMNAIDRRKKDKF